MEHKKTVSGSAQSLECLYNECPEEFDDLTFKYLTNIPQNQQKKSAAESTRSCGEMAKISPGEPEIAARSDLASGHHRRKSEHDHSRRAEEEIKRERLARSWGSGKGFTVAEESAISMPSPGRAGQTQPKGNPHSNICAYINIFRHRCLVCGRVYCKYCVGTGMGKMTEGRKCLECLGRRFSRRYIGRAGKTGFCCGYSSEVKKRELIWAEKGASTRDEEKPEQSGSEPKGKGEGTRESETGSFILASTASFNSNYGVALQGR